MGHNYRKNGCVLYSALPYTYFTGVYRMLGVKNFTKEKLIGFVFDAIFTLVLFII